MSEIDIRLLVSFKGHRKRKRLKRLIGPDATDYLIDLWLTVRQDRPDGILSGWDEIDIADAAGWPEDRDPKKLVSALIDSGWIDYDKSVYILHDWDEHQGWACGETKRKESAKIAARAKWKKRLIVVDKDADGMRPQYDSNATAEKAHCGNDATAMRSHEKRNAPSPIPSPSPTPVKDISNEISAPPSTPTPEPEKSKPAAQAPPAENNKIINSNHFTNRVGDLVDKIKRHCDDIDIRCKLNGKRFNPWEWVTKQTNSRGHPLAIAQSLEWLLVNWDDVDKPWGFIDSTFKTKNPKFNERQELEDSKAFKLDKTTADKEFKKLWSTVMKRAGPS